MEPQTPQAHVEARLGSVWRELLGFEAEPQDSFFEVGGDSLLVAELVARARRAGLTIAAADVFGHPVFGELTGLVAGRVGAPQPVSGTVLPVVTAQEVWNDYLNPWDASAPRCIVPILRGEGTPIFVVHWGAGNVKFVAEVADRWSGGRPVYGIEAAGYRGQVRPFLSIGDMAERYVAELLELQSEGPYDFIGLCHGGVVAVEMAHRLRMCGREVGTLSLINLDPLAPYVDHGWGVDEIVRLRLSSLESRFGLHATADFERVLGAMRADQWYDDEIEPNEIMRLQLLWAAHVYALQHYQPRPYDGRVVVFEPTAFTEPLHKNWLSSLGNAHIHWYADLGERLLPLMRHPEVIAMIAAEYRQG